MSRTHAPASTASGRAGGAAVRLESDGTLRRLVLDRPPLNVLDIATLKELGATVRRVATDPGAGVLLVTGEGKAFSAGVDVADHTEARVHAMMRVFHDALTALLELEIPTVAALNGAALGGGLEVALACDVVLARAGAKLGQPEIQLGVFPPFAAAVLPRLVGPARAMDLCLTGRTVSAEEAHAFGLVQHVFDAEGFRDAAEDYARRMAGLSAPVLRLTKRAVRAGVQGPLPAALAEAERIYLEELMELQDAREGLAAFMEKRPPVWKGA